MTFWKTENFYKGNRIVVARDLRDGSKGVVMNR